MSFDTLAPHYRWIEFVSAGNKLQRCRTAFLDRIAGSRNLLILGEGNGRFLAECVRAFPGTRITCVDASERMLGLARRRLQRNSQDLSFIQFVHADALQWLPKENYDCIVTHFFLDCFRSDQLELLISKLARVATANARWLLADFRTPHGGITRWRAEFILASLYAFFRAATGLAARRLTPPDVLLERNGFKLRERTLRDWSLLHSDIWERTPV